MDNKTCGQQGSGKPLPDSDKKLDAESQKLLQEVTNGLPLFIAPLGMYSLGDQSPITPEFPVLSICAVVEQKKKENRDF